MALTNAERQKRYREKMKAEGKKRLVVWHDDGSGLFAVPTEGGTWPSMEWKEFKAVLKRLVKQLPTWPGAQDNTEAEEVFYAELAAYAAVAARRVTKLMTPSDDVLDTLKREGLLRNENDVVTP